MTVSDIVSLCDKSTKFFIWNKIGINDIMPKYIGDIHSIPIDLLDKEVEEMPAIKVDVMDYGLIGLSIVLKDIKNNE